MMTITLSFPDWCAVVVAGAITLWSGVSIALMITEKWELHTLWKKIKRQDEQSKGGQ